MGGFNLTMLQLILRKVKILAQSAANTLQTRGSRFKKPQIPSSLHAVVTCTQERQKLWGHDSHDGLVLQNDSSVVVADVAKGVPMGLWQPICKRGTSDRIRLTVALLERNIEPSYVRPKPMFSCRFPFRLMTFLSGVGKAQTCQAGCQRRNAASGQVLMIYHFGSDQHHFLGGHDG